MVCCSANWGAGGYLSVRLNNSNASGGDSASSPGTAAAAAAAAAGAGTGYSAELSLVDATLANKPRAAVFRLVSCDGYTPQPFVGGKLMRNPGPPGPRPDDNGRGGTTREGLRPNVGGGSGAWGR